MGDELMGNVTETRAPNKIKNINKNSKEWGQSWRKKLISQRRLSVDDVNALNDDHCKWIKEQIVLAKKDKMQLIILTHHAPTSYKCISPIERNEDVSFLMNFNSMEHMFKYPVIGWCFGHTHRNCDFCVVSESGKDKIIKWRTRICSNQLGYYEDGRFEAKDYSADKVIKFPMKNHDDKSIKHIDRKELMQKVKADKE